MFGETEVQVGKEHQNADDDHGDEKGNPRLQSRGKTEKGRFWPAKTGDFGYPCLELKHYFSLRKFRKYYLLLYAPLRGCQRESLGESSGYRLEGFRSEAETLAASIPTFTR
jgi:hypothetical protein